MATNKPCYLEDELSLADINLLQDIIRISRLDGSGSKKITLPTLFLAFLKIYGPTLDGYDANTVKALCSKGDGSNNVEWKEVLLP